MAVIGNDAYGPYLDTGVSTTPTPRPSVEVEVHYPAEIDSGSKISPLIVSTTHQPHRSATSPR